MLRLQCYLFGKLVREMRDRSLDHSEQEFLERHRCKCTSCRQREESTSCSLDALTGATLEIAPPSSHHELIHQVEGQSGSPRDASLWATAIATASFGTYVVLGAIAGTWHMLVAQIPETLQHVEKFFFHKTS